ncbi:MAG TPA: hypothetical protein DCQ50_14210, partial [Chryseobacterium sp.]|nr:hypothetical protein [Chryseobacterium sp.]
MRNKTRMILTPVFIAFLVLVLTISFSSNLLSKAKNNIDFIFAGNQKSGSAKSVACYLINGKTPVKLSKNYSSNA